MDGTFPAYQLKVAVDGGIIPRHFTGAGTPHLTRRRLAEMEVVVSALVGQKRIVAKVDQLMKICDQFEAALRRADNAASKLAEARVRELT